MKKLLIVLALAIATTAGCNLLNQWEAKIQQRLEAVPTIKYATWACPKTAQHKAGHPLK